MSIETLLTRRLHVKHPIIQAPLAGGGDTPELVAAVSNAGGIGFIGAAYLSPQQIEQTSGLVRAKTERPFGINLFAPAPAPQVPQNAEVARALEQCDRLELAITQFHAEGLRFAAFTLLRMVFAHGTAFTEPVHIATQNLKSALERAGYPH